MGFSYPVNFCSADNYVPSAPLFHYHSQRFTCRISHYTSPTWGIVDSPSYVFVLCFTSLKFYLYCVCPVCFGSILLSFFWIVMLNPVLAEYLNSCHQHRSSVTLYHSNDPSSFHVFVSSFHLYGNNHTYLAVWLQGFKIDDYIKHTALVGAP